MTANKVVNVTLDIGSNSVRLVALKPKSKNGKPKTLLEIKRSCGVAAGMTRAHPVLNPKGCDTLLEFLDTCHAKILDLQEEHGAKREIRVTAVATAAFRAVQHTTAGNVMLKAMEQRLGHPIQVISGEKEACLSALGVMKHLPIISGIVADLGGGSLELALIKNGQIVRALSLPLGTHTLDSEVRHRTALAGQMLQRELQRCHWPRNAAPNLYLVGGTWRANARVIQILQHSPVRKIHGYRKPTVRVLGTLDKITGMIARDFRNMNHKIKARATKIPIAAAALAGLIRYTKAKQIIFSGKGLREGLLYADELPNDCSRELRQSLCSAPPTPTHPALAPAPPRQTARAASL